MSYNHHSGYSFVTTEVKKPEKGYRITQVRADGGLDQNRNRQQEYRSTWIQQIFSK